MAVFYNVEGARYETDDPVEITRLSYSRFHFRQPPDEVPVAEQLSTDDGRFHPAGAKVEDVNAKLDEVGRESPEGLRILAEERAAGGRKGVLKDDAPA